jgi:translation initiation factor 2 subunit 2
MEKKKFYDYDFMLEKARKNIPEQVSEKVVFEVPKVQASIQGKRTILNNFAEIADVINRSQSHFLKYLSKELATAGVIEGRRVVFQGKFGFMQLKNKIENYVKDYVICKQCGRHDTKLIHEGRVWFVKCMACGAREPVRGI